MEQAAQAINLTFPLKEMAAELQTRANREKMHIARLQAQLSDLFQQRLENTLHTIQQQNQQQGHGGLFGQGQSTSTRAYSFLSLTSTQAIAIWESLMITSGTAKGKKNTNLYYIYSYSGEEEKSANASRKSKVQPYYYPTGIICYPPIDFCSRSHYVRRNSGIGCLRAKRS